MTAGRHPRAGAIARDADGLGGAHDALVLAPAKLNLVLAVGKRRRDGYHPLVSVMQAIDLADELHVSVAPLDDGVGAGHADVHVDVPGLEGGDTLVTRALQHLARDAGLSFRARVRIDKRIPVGAGLGGGSSDAGIALRTVNELLGSPCDHALLAQVAAGIGSDVPFFLVDSGTAVVTGRGEQVRELPALAPSDWLVCWPAVETGTAGVYARFQPWRDRLPTPEEAWRDARDGRYANDLTEAAITGCAALGRLVDALHGAGARVLLAGSGSAVAVPLSRHDDHGVLEHAARDAGAVLVRRSRTCSTRLYGGRG